MATAPFLGASIDKLGPRKVWLGLIVAVMVQHHHIHPQRAGGFKRRAAGSTTIHRDDQTRAFGLQSSEGWGRRAIAFRHPVGDIETWGRAQTGEKFRQQRRRHRAVHVVIAEHRDTLALLQRRGHPRHGDVHFRQHAGIGHQFFQGGMEVILHARRFDTARRQKPGCGRRR